MQRNFIPLNIAVMTISDSRTEDNDKSGNSLVEHLTAAGHNRADKLIVPDDIYQMRAAISAWIANPDINAIITTGSINNKHGFIVPMSYMCLNPALLYVP